MIGVSPAYFISRYTDRFTVHDIVASLPDIKAMGYDGFEPEIYHADTLPTWRNGGAVMVRDVAMDVGLTPTQFVAHFLIKAFDNPIALASPFGLAEMREALNMIEVFHGISTIVIPFGAFKAPQNDPVTDKLAIHKERLIEKLGILLSYVEATGRKMALEIMPNSLIGDFSHFLQLCESLKSDKIGINYDTGHANASKENLDAVPALLGTRILGTHLCDNFGDENLSLAPGRASIDFAAVINGLTSFDYKGSWDIEIICNPAEVQREYSAGLEHIQDILKKG